VREDDLVAGGIFNDRRIDRLRARSLDRAMPIPFSFSTWSSRSVTDSVIEDDPARPASLNTCSHPPAGNRHSATSGIGRDRLDIALVHRRRTASSIFRFRCFLGLFREPDEGLFWT
jgi:hypothetical protein